MGLVPGGKLGSAIKDMEDCGSTADGGKGSKVKCVIGLEQIVFGGAIVRRGALDGRNIRTMDVEWRCA